MPKLEKHRVVTIARKRSRPDMAVIIRGVPGGHNWGWHSREDPRMHLQLLDKVPSWKVWLEEKGERVFEPVGKVPARLLNPLRSFVDEHRLAVEDKWVRLMLDKQWLHIHVALPKLTLVAYPNMPSKFVRVIDLTTWFDRKQLDSLRPDIIDLNREMASLRLWSDRPETDTYDARLSRLLWGKELSGR